MIKSFLNKNIYFIRCFWGILFAQITLVGFSQRVSINITGTAAASTNMLEVTQTSTAANSVAVYAINSAATAGTGYGLYSTITGASSTANVAGYFNAVNGAANYAIVVPNGGGNVGFGTLTPASLLHVAGAAQLGSLNTVTGLLKLYSSGSASATTFRTGNFTATLTLPVADGASGNALSTNGSGVLSWGTGPTNVWLLTGNSGTSAGIPASNFIGPTDAVDFAVKTNSVERMRVLSTGNAGVGMNAPASLLHSAGTISTGNNLPGVLGSILFYNSTNSNTTGFQSGNTTTTPSVIYTLPTADGAAGSMLETDGAHNMYWGPNAGPAGPTGPTGPVTVISGTTTTNSGTTPYTFTPGAGTIVMAELWGAGGGGAGGNNITNNTAGGGGGGGCYGKVIFTAIAGTYTAYIGTGGAGGLGTNPATNGTDGGNSYIKPPGGFGNIGEVGGGKGGTIQTALSTVGSPGGLGGAAVSTGIISSDGGEGGVGTHVTGGAGGLRGGGNLALGNTSFGGGGGAGGGSGGGSGGRGGAVGVGVVGSNGHAGGYPGGGGGGGSTKGSLPCYSGGAGANGLVVVSY